MIGSSARLLILLLPFLVVESALVQNNLHILRRSLLQKGVYDRHVKPDGKVDVMVGVRVLDMDLCPKRHVLRTNTWTTFIWTDPRLAFDKADYDGIDRFQISSEEVWLPDITLYNSAAAPEMYYSHVKEPSNVVIFNSGMVMFVPMMEYKSHCNINFNNWPWGQQHCQLIFGSWTYDMDHVNPMPMNWGGKDYTLKFGGDDNDGFEFFGHNRIDVQYSNYTRTEKEYDADPGRKYPRMDLDLFFEQKMVFDHNTAKYNPDYSQNL